MITKKSQGTHLRALLENQEHHSLWLKPVPVKRHCKTCQCLTWEVFPPSVSHQQWPGHSLHQSYQNSPTPPQSTAATRSRRHRFHPPRLNLHSQPSRQNASSQTDQIFSRNYWKQTGTRCHGRFFVAVFKMPTTFPGGIQSISWETHTGTWLSHTKLISHPKKTLKSYLSPPRLPWSAMYFCWFSRSTFVSCNPGFLLDLVATVNAFILLQHRRLHRTVTWSIIRRLLLLFAL